MALHEITVNTQSYLNPFFPIVRSLTTPQRHIITLPNTYLHWRQTLLETPHATV